jgi:hypothetical protein
VSVFDFKYALTVITMFGFACASLGYYMYQSFHLHDGLPPKEDHVDNILLDEIFLIIQFLGIGFVILLSITFTSFLGFLIVEGCLHHRSQDDDEQEGLTI